MQINYDDILNVTRDKLVSIADIATVKGWEQQVNKDGYLIHTMNNPENGLKISRTETVANVDIDQLSQLLFNFPRRKEYDENFIEGRLIEQIDDNTKIFYGRGKPPVFFVDAREFVVLIRIQKTGDGYLIYGKSVDHQNEPAKKGITRGEMVLLGYILKKQPDGSTRVTIIGNMNPKGDIPKTIINNGYKFQAEILKKAIAHQIKLQKK